MVKINFMGFWGFGARSHTPTHLDRVTASPKIGTTVDSRPPAATRRENVVSNIRSISCWFADQSSDQSHLRRCKLIFGPSDATLLTLYVGSERYTQPVFSTP